jgi:hypothetical protein
VCVPNNEEIRKLILEEAHFSPHTVHPGGTKMYQDLKRRFWWNGMKRDVVEFMERCSTCQQVKAEISKTYRTITTSEDTDMEMGSDSHGLFSMVTPNSSWV